MNMNRLLTFVGLTLAGQILSQSLFAAEPATIPLPQPIDLKPNSVYNLVSLHSGLCLDVKDHGTANGVILQQWACTGEEHQKFRIVVQYDGSYTLQAVPSGRFITVAGASRENAAPALIWDNQNALNQKFSFEPANGGSYIARFSHSQKCLDVSGPSTANGAVVHQWECLNAPNQQWAFREVAAPQPTEGTYTLVSRRSGKCLDVFEHGLASGVRLQQWTCTGEPHQKFRLKKFSDGSLALIGFQSNKTVTVPGYSRDNGAPVIQADDIGGSNQRFRLYTSANGSFTVRFDHSSKCLDVSNLSYDDGAIVHQWECVNGDNQDWFFKKELTSIPQFPTDDSTYTVGEHINEKGQSVYTEVFYDLASSYLTPNSSGPYGAGWIIDNAQASTVEGEFRKASVEFKGMYVEDCVTGKWVNVLRTEYAYVSAPLGIHQGANRFSLNHFYPKTFAVSAPPLIFLNERFMCDRAGNGKYEMLRMPGIDENGDGMNDLRRILVQGTGRFAYVVEHK